MYKLKYYSLDKNEQNNLKDEFYKTESGQKVNNYLKRLLLYGILGIVFSICLILSYKDSKNIFDLTSAIILIIASVIFIIASFKIRIKKLNDYLVKKK